MPFSSVPARLRMEPIIQLMDTMDARGPAAARTAPQAFMDDCFRVDTPDASFGGARETGSPGCFLGRVAHGFGRQPYRALQLRLIFWRGTGLRVRARSNPARDGARGRLRRANGWTCPRLSCGRGDAIIDEVLAPLTEDKYPCSVARDCLFHGTKPESLLLAGALLRLVFR